MRLFLPTAAPAAGPWLLTHVQEMPARSLEAGAMTPGRRRRAAAWPTVLSPFTDGQLGNRPDAATPRTRVVSTAAPADSRSSACAGQVVQGPAAALPRCRHDPVRFGGGAQVLYVLASATLDLVCRHPRRWTTRANDGGKPRDDQAGPRPIAGHFNSFVTRPRFGGHWLRSAPSRQPWPQDLANRRCRNGALSGRRAARDGHFHGCAEPMRDQCVA